MRLSPQKFVFLRGWLAHSRLPFPIISVKDSFQQKNLYQRNVDNHSLHHNNVMAIQDVPGYLDLKFEDSPNSLVKRIISQSTYVVRLDTYSSIKEYLKQNFGPKSRSALKRYQRRLETCFNIHYSCYFGDIEKKHFDKLILALRELMQRRFQRKKERNYELQHLNEIANDVYPLILQKKACLYVIYDEETPISIRINMMKDGFAYYLLSAYDPDFDAFRLGKIDMIVNIKWLLEQNYQIYDLLKGYAHIKERWADESYDVYLYLTLENGNIFSRFVFFFQTLLLKSFYVLVDLAKRLKIDALFKRAKRTVYSDRSIREKLKLHHVRRIDLTPSINEKKCFRLKDISNTEFLKLPVYNLAYKHQLKVEKIQVFPEGNNGKIFYARLGDSCYELSFK